MTPAEALNLLAQYARWAAAYNESGLGYRDTAVTMRIRINEAEQVLREALDQQTRE
jgi:hypothetical protein